MARSPVGDGWRVLMRAPVAVIAEIAWRWTFGVGMWAIFYYGFGEYFASVEISRTEYALMRLLEPATWIAITARVMVAFITGLHMIGPIIIPAIAILWIAMATVGRVGTVRAICEAVPQTNWFSTAGLNLSRAVIAVAAVLAFFGSGILINELVSDPSQHPAAIVLLATVALVVIAFIWSVANWFLSLAAIFTVRDGVGFFSSLGRAVELYRGQSDSLYSSGFWFGLLRTVLVIAATIFSLLPIARFSASRAGVAVLIVAVVTLAYFALADALYMWRLATYVALSEPEPQQPVWANPEIPAAPEPAMDESGATTGDSEGGPVPLERNAET